MSIKDKVLLVDDEEDIRNVVSSNLESIGLDTAQAGDGEEGLSKALSGDYALVILDVMMPKLSGVEVCRKLRVEKPDLPIIMLTERKEEIDRVVGLELGADDYITKPFSMPELMARVKNILKRSKRQAALSVQNQGDETQPITIGELTIDPTRRVITKGNDRVEISRIEFDLLHFLALHPGRAFEHSELLQAVWGVDNPGYEVNIKTNISRLRKKIEDDSTSPKYILTVHGIGYRFAEMGDLEAE